MSAEPADIILQHMRDLAEAAAGRRPEERSAVVAGAAKRLLKELSGRYIPADRSGYGIFLEEWKKWTLSGRERRFQVARVAARCGRTPRTIARWKSKLERSRTSSRECHHIGPRVR